MRLDIAVVYSDGRRGVVTVGRPADLIAFAEKFDKIGPDGPQAVREIAWLAHRALKIELPLEAWLDTLDELTADPKLVAKVRAEVDKAGETDPTTEASKAARPTRIASGSPA